MEHKPAKSPTEPQGAPLQGSNGSGSAGDPGRRPQHAGPQDGTQPLPALVRLLDDESPQIWASLRTTIEGQGKAALPILRCALLHGGPRARVRARLMLEARAKEHAKRRLVRYVSAPKVDLEQGLLLLGRYVDPSLDLRVYSRILDRFAQEVVRLAGPGTSSLHRAMALVDYLGHQLGFGGAAHDFHHPDNTFLHRALETHRGLPLTLTAVYMAVARRAHVLAEPLALPGHVVLRLSGAGRQILVDPFDNGSVKSMAECRDYLARSGFRNFRHQWFQPASDRDLFARQLTNLARSFEERGLVQDLHRMTHVMTALRGRSKLSKPRRR